MAPTDKYVTANGLRLHYLDYGGEGKPALLFIHGLTGHAHTFDAVASRFIGRYHTLSMDVRGRGESEWSPQKVYHYPAYVADLAAFLDALGIERVTLVGTSMGGWITMFYAAAYPERVARAVINDIGPEVELTGLMRILSYVMNAPARFPDMETAKAWFRANYPEMLHRLSDAELEAWAGYSLKSEAKSEAPDGAGGLTWRLDPAIRVPAPPPPEQPNPWEAWTAITCPVLLLRAENSDLLSRETAQKMVETGADVRLAPVAGMGHAPTLTEPDAVEALDAFLLA